MQEADSRERARLASQLILATGGGHVAQDMAHDFFKAELQDTEVHTVIGPVWLNGKTWREMRRNIRSDALKAALLPLVPAILERGYLVGGREPNTKDRRDFVAFYFIRLDGIAVGDVLVDAGVTVGERPDGSFEYPLNAYALGHAQMLAWQRKVAGAHPQVTSPGRSGDGGAAEPALDNIMVVRDELVNRELYTKHGDANLVILRVRRAALDRTRPVAGALLDALDGAGRARIAAQLAAKVAQLKDESLDPLTRMRLARDIAALVAQLAGSALPVAGDGEPLTTLRRIAAGAQDALGVRALLDRMAAAAAALTAAEQMDKDAAKAAHAAIDHWAELEAASHE